MSIQGQLLEVSVTGCRKLRDTEFFSRQAPYVIVEYANTKLRTRTCTDGGRNPSFDEKFHIPLIEGLRELNVNVWNSNTTSADDFIGSCRVPLNKVLTNGYDNASWPLHTQHMKSAGEVELIIHFDVSAMNNKMDVCEIQELNDVSSSSAMLPAVPPTAEGDAQLGGILPVPPAPEDDDGWMAVMAECVQWSSIISTVITAIKLVGEAVVFSVKPFGEWIHLDLSVPKEVLLCSSPESLCIMSLAALMTGFWNIYGVHALERRHARGRRFHGVLVYILKQLTKPLLVGMLVLVMFFRRLSPSVKFAMGSDAFEIFGILLQMLQRTFASLRSKIPTM